MASFRITEFTDTSVTIRVGGIVSGDIIRFYVCPTGSQDTSTHIDKEYTALDTFMVQTFHKLIPDTDYSANVKVGDNWLGTQTFVTEETLEDQNNSLSDIYVLPRSYPTFDWADWPESKAALVSNGLTINFESAAWNAIVTFLANALSAAGLEWDNTYTTANDAKLGSYDDFRADMFNSVRYNIDFPAPLGWAWANNPSFRGFVGREDFLGWDEYGENSDYIYPEYIIELVRKLNLLIGVMTGNKAIVTGGNGDAESLVYGGIRSSPSLPIVGDVSSISNYNRAGIDMLKGDPIYPRGHSESFSDANILIKPSLVIPSIKRIVNTFFDFQLRLGVAAPIFFSPLTTLIKSNGFLNPILFRAANLEIINKKSAIRYYAFAISVQALPFSSGGLSRSLEIATYGVAKSLPFGGNDLSESISNDPELRYGQSAAFNAAENSSTNGQLNLIGLQGARIQYRKTSKTSNMVTLDSAWWPPEWINGGLWIRQSHEVTLTDGVLEVV